jgi:ribosomal protein S14
MDKKMDKIKKNKVKKKMEMENESEECVRCGRLTAEGSELCEKCLENDAKYQNWKNDLNSSYEY